MLVPVPVQHEIAQKAPHVAYVPARLAPGWRYASWQAPHGALQIAFTNKAGQLVVFLVTPFKGDCRFGMEKSFQMAGVKVYWSHNGGQQVAWRCVNGLKLVAATSLAPNRFADVGLGRMAASGHRVSG